MTVDQLTNLAWEVVSELEPSRSFDVFDVTDSQIIFHDGHGLVRVSCLNTNGSLKERIKKELKQ